MLEADWNKERDLVTKILALRNQLQPPQGDGESNGEDATVDRASLLDQLRNHEKDLTVLQGENPLILPSVDRQAVAAVSGGLDGHSRWQDGKERNSGRPESREQP